VDALEIGVGLQFDPHFATILATYMDNAVKICNEVLNK